MLSAPTIRLELRTSRLACAATIMLVVASISALMLTAWPLPLRLLAIGVYIGLAASGVALSRRSARTEWVEWRADGAWYLKTFDLDMPFTADLRDYRLFGSLIRLDLRAGHRRRTLTLWPDSADAEALRRLRIRLPREGISVAISPSADAVR